MNWPASAVLRPQPATAEYRAIHFAGEIVGGGYALYAVSALCGEPLSRAGWIGAALLVLAMAAGSGWRIRTSIGARVVWELVLLVLGVLIAPVVPGWQASWTERAYFVFVARGLSWLLRWGERVNDNPCDLDWRERLRLLLLSTLSGVTLLSYLSTNLVGPKDARWYGNMVTDYLTQLRGGKFPVFSGETIYSFNGTVHLYRSAPWHLHFAGLVDLLTLQSLSPLAVQHIIIVASYLGAVLLFYIGLVRLRPAARWTAFLLTTVYASSPAIMQPLVEHDMFMTFMTAPAFVFVCFAVARVCEAPSLRNHVWVGLGCAAMWLGHPPLALMSTVMAAFFMGAQFAINGPTLRATTLMAVTAAVFGILAAPYFYAMSEIPPTHEYDPLPHLVLPALALFFLILALAQFVRTGRIGWLALLPTVWLILLDFKPSLLPFTALFIAFFAVAAAADRFRPRLVMRIRPEPWFLAIFFAAAAAAATWFPDVSLPAGKVLNSAIGPVFTSLIEPLRAIIYGSDCQPHAVWWLLLFAGMILVWRSDSTFARLAFAAAMVTTAAIFPVPLVKPFLWSNTTIEIWDIVYVADRMRCWPLTMPLLLFAVFPMLAELAERSPARHRLIMGAVIACLPWALWEHGKIVRSIFVNTAEQTARLFRPENIVLQNYNWDLLHIPSYFAGGVMDCRMETRLWRQGGDHALLIDPDEIARSLEMRGAEVLELRATVDPTYPEWVYLAPKIELRPGEHKLLRFDFMGRELRGWLIVRGQDIYRDYRLPSSGFERSFGSGALNTRTLSLWNSGFRTETLELVVKREGPDATVGIPPGTFMRVTVCHYDASRAPIEVKSLSPLLLRVDAPERGMLELFRSNVPGYRVSVNGHPVPHITSHEGLIAFAVPAGGSEILVRFRGTWQLRAMFWYGLAVWTLAAIYLGTEAVAAGFFPRRATASTA